MYQEYNPIILIIPINTYKITFFKNICLDLMTILSIDIFNTVSKRKSILIIMHNLFSLWIYFLYTGNIFSLWVFVNNIYMICVYRTYFVS